MKCADKIGSNNQHLNICDFWAHPIGMNYSPCVVVVGVIFFIFVIVIIGIVIVILWKNWKHEINIKFREEVPGKLKSLWSWWKFLCV